MDRAEQVRLIHESESVPAAWRVYVFEWISQGWYPTREEAAARDNEFDGKVLPRHIEVRDDVMGGFMVWVQQWNVDSEWKHAGAAEYRIAELRKTRYEEDPQVVARGSLEEQELVRYGRVTIV